LTIESLGFAILRLQFSVFFSGSTAQQESEQCAHDGNETHRQLYDGLHQFNGNSGMHDRSRSGCIVGPAKRQGQMAFATTNSRCSLSLFTYSNIGHRISPHRGDFGDWGMFLVVPIREVRPGKAGIAAQPLNYLVPSCGNHGQTQNDNYGHDDGIILGG
jgi:hypothetical protein